MAETNRPQAWVTTVAPEEADGALKEAYDWQAKRLGELIAQLAANPLAGGTGSTRLDEIVRYAAILTRSPGAVSEDDIDALRAVGLSDADIVALNNLAAYYSYTNRA